MKTELAQVLCEEAEWVAATQSGVAMLESAPASGAEAEWVASLDLGELSVWE